MTVNSCAGDNDNDFPSTLKGYTDTVNWLKEEFRLQDDREAIVLLGAHTMGNAEVENSGHRGPWTQDPNVYVCLPFKHHCLRNLKKHNFGTDSNVDLRDIL